MNLEEIEEIEGIKCRRRIVIIAVLKPRSRIRIVGRKSSRWKEKKRKNAGNIGFSTRSFACRKVSSKSAAGTQSSKSPFANLTKNVPS